MSGVPKGWAAIRLGEAVSLDYGKSLPATDRSGGQYAVFGSNGIVGQHSEAITASPAIVVGRKGSFGEVHFSDYPCFPIDTTYYVDSFDVLNARFAFHLLRHLPLKEMNRSSAIPGLNREDAYGLGIGLPPLPEQRRIVAKVDGLTARTARARKVLDRIPALIAQYKQRLLVHIFTTASSPGGVTRIGELADFVTSGSRGWAQYYSDDGDLFVRVGNVMRTDIDLDLRNVQRVTPPPGAEGRRTQLEANDLLITITADLGRVGVYEDVRTGYINQHIALVRLAEPWQAKYVAWYLSSEFGQIQLLKNTRGATKAGLGLDDIRGVTIPIPNEKEQEEIVRRLESAFGWLDRMAADHAAAARLLPKLDAAILAKAFRGELVPQDPNDEPATKLLERIKAEREAEGEKAKVGVGGNRMDRKRKL